MSGGIDWLEQFLKIYFIYIHTTRVKMIGVK